jgi:HSP20 family molecular chaperone IbpA
MLKSNLFDELMTIQNNFDHLVDHLFERPEPRLRIPAEPESRWVPAAEGFIDKEKVTLRVFLPDVDEKSVSLTQTDDVLVIEGERHPVGFESARMILKEFPTGKFMRTLTLPEDVVTDGEKCVAKLNNGVLEITLPIVSQYIQKRKIEIQTGESKQDRVKQVAS